MKRAAKDTPEGARRRADAEPDTEPDRPGVAMRNDPKFGPSQHFKDDQAGGNRYEGGLSEGKRTHVGGNVPFVNERAGDTPRLRPEDARTRQGKGRDDKGHAAGEEE